MSKKYSDNAQENLGPTLFSIVLDLVAAKGSSSYILKGQSTI